MIFIIFISKPFSSFLQQNTRQFKTEICLRKLLGIVLAVLFTGQVPFLSPNQQWQRTKEQETLKQHQANLYKLPPLFSIRTNASNDLWKINATSQREGRQEANNIHDVLITTGLADLQNIRWPQKWHIQCFIRSCIIGRNFEDKIFTAVP